MWQAFTEWMRKKLKRAPARISLRHLHKHMLELHEAVILVHEAIVQVITTQNSHSHKLVTIVATQAQLAQDLQAVSTQLAKIGTETQTLLQKITELEAAVGAGGGTTPEVDAAVAALKSQAQVVDDLVQDAAP